MIQEVLTKLQELQEILAQKYEVEMELHDIPKSLTTKTELVNRLNQSYLEKLDRIQASEHKVSDLNNQLLDAEKNRELYEERIGTIETQREFESLTKEIRYATEKEESYRKDLQKEEKQLSEMKQSIASDKQLIDEQKRELEADKEKNVNETKLREQTISELELKEQEIVPALDKEIVFKFERIIRSKKGKGIVPLSRSVCSGCNMILPLQFVNEVREEKEVKFCPYCSMILYYIEDSEAQEITQDDDFFLDDSDSFSDEFEDDFEDEAFSSEHELDEFDFVDASTEDDDLDGENDDRLESELDDDSVEEIEHEDEHEIMEDLDDM